VLFGLGMVVGMVMELAGSAIGYCRVLITICFFGWRVREAITMGNRMTLYKKW
jgi:hypothetical protein